MPTICHQSIFKNHKYILYTNRNQVFCLSCLSFCKPSVYRKT